MEIKELDLNSKLSQKEIISRLKTYLQSLSEGLREAHLGSLGGLESCRLRALSLDHLFHAVLSILPETHDKPEDSLPVTIVAVGGYGRGELNPFSDIDILILHSPKMISGNKPDPELSSITDGILYKLWDCGLKVGHAVRTVDQCIQHAKEDMQSLTGLLESRFICGSKELFQELESAVQKKCIAGSEDKYMEMRLRDQEERREKYGNSPFLQTPNIKNGCGGLRDFQNLMWMAYFKFRVRSLEDIVHRHAITQDECRKLTEAYDFLLKVRSELHYQEERPVDTLQRANQHKIAKALGYPQRSMVKIVEVFMHDYYVHVRNIYLISKTAEKNLALTKSHKSLPTFKQVIQSRSFKSKKRLIDGFSISDGLVVCINYQKVVEQPHRLMRLFLYVQKFGLNLHPSLELSIRDHVPNLSPMFQNNPKSIETFLEIISQRGSVARILRMMHELEVLGKFLPEFGRMTCLVQHEFLHQYTTDEHTLVCIEHLDKIWTAKKIPHVKYQELLREVEHPFEIYLSLMLHDCGKAVPGKKHEEVGARMMQKVGKRFGLSKSSINRITRVVELHLLIPIVSQRRDLDDPIVITEVATEIKSRRLLRILTIHTFCDSMGTSSSLWSEFKDMLLWQLYHATHKVLEGDDQFLKLEEQEIKKKIRRIKRQAGDKVLPEEFKAHVDNLPDRYFVITRVDDIILDMSLVRQFLEVQFDEKKNPLAPIIHWELKKSRGYAVAKICTWNRERFFSRVAGSITLAGLTILSAQIYSRLDGIVIDTFVLIDATTGKIPDIKKRKQFESFLEKSLTKEFSFDEMLVKKGLQRPDSQTALDAVIDTRVRVRNDLSDAYNVVEVTAPDEPGLLYHVSRKLSDLGLDIWLAKVITERGAAIDTFYFAEIEGGKIEDDYRLELIDSAIKQVLAKVIDIKEEGDWIETQ